ncbi:hypothetical protein MY10362_009882 [Beauveria mimosiformis]
MIQQLPPQGQGALQHINNATLGFQKIFVIGLPERTDRRDGLTLQAALSNLKVDFMDGVRGEHIAEMAIPVTEVGVTLDAPVLGCWRGHMNAVAEVVRQNLSSVLILEDDADWDRNLWSINVPFTLKEEYAEHTRAVHDAQEGVCTVGYALSQRGARRILEEIALKPVTEAYDILMRFFCEGTHGRKRASALQRNHHISILIGGQAYRAQ